MTYTCFDVQITDGIAHIILNRPEKRNAMIAEFWTELPEIIHDIDANAKARVIVLSSTGPVFCAGLDVGMFQTDIGGTEDKNHPQFGAKFYGTVQRLQAALSCLETCRIPAFLIICQKAWCANLPIQDVKWAQRNVRRADYLMMYIQIRKPCLRKFDDLPKIKMT